MSGNTNSDILIVSFSFVIEIQNGVQLTPLGWRNCSVHSRFACISPRYTKDTFSVPRICTAIHGFRDGEAESRLISRHVPRDWQCDHCNITIMYEQFLLGL